jgi:beta-lactamase superfamily II metal-dependent hydrolase
MTTQATSERESPEPSNSEQGHLEVHLFACGHGDTILVRLPDGRWVLIDCHLPKAGGVRKRFFHFVQERKIETLALVFQTHPDYDHFLGMRDVLEHFLQKDGHPVIQYVDSGLTPQEIRDLLTVPQRPGRNEYCRLHKSLRDWDKQGRIDRRELDAERPPVSPHGFRGCIDFIPIAPDPKARRRLTEASLEKYARNQNVKFEANELSVVLVLAVNDTWVKTNILLGADAHTEGIRRAIKVWDAHAAERSISANFQVIKIPHHGSIKNHFADLCQRGCERPAPSVAAVSAGTRAGIPDREVLSGYLRVGWTVMLTTTRKCTTVNRPGELHIKSMARPSFQEGSIKLAWDDAGEFSFGPPEAIVSTRDLAAYEIAPKDTAVTLP